LFREWHFEVLAMENGLVAGGETTGNSIAAGLHRLAIDQDRQRRLCEGPAATANFGEKLLRIEALLQTRPRVVTLSPRERPPRYWLARFLCFLPVKGDYRYG
jgi:hypothetical protein